jgi:hypothetical protein
MTPNPDKRLRHRTLARHAEITYGSVLAAFGLLLIGYLTGMLVHHWGAPLGYRVGSAWQAYGGLFVLAAAIERLIQPFSDVLGDAPQARDSAAAPTVSDAPQRPDSAAAPILSQTSLLFTKIDVKSKRNTAVVTWGLASGLGCLACALLGVGLLTAIMGASSSTPAPALDVLVSGLVVGAGTKPLHDLITNIQASKDTKQAQVPTAPPG